MLQNASLNQNASGEQIGATKEDLADLLATTNLNHPALSRVRMRLGALTEIDSGVESRITSYDRMHHRHSRS